MREKAQSSKVKVENAAVTIYRVKNRATILFQVCDYTSGKRKLVSFANEQDARSKAREIAVKLANGDRAVLSMTADERASYVRAVDLLRPTGKPLELAAAEYADAVKRLDGRGLLEAANFFVSRFPKSMPHRTVAEAVEECLEAKKSDGVSEVYLHVLELRLRRFAGAFRMSLMDLTAAKVNDWLRSLRCSGRTRNNYKSDLVTFLHFCEAQGCLPKDHIAGENLAQAEEQKGRIEIFTPAEVTKIIDAAQSNRDLLVHVLLGAFAGLRSAESQRQQWRDVNLERGFLKVTGAKLGTPANRLVYLADNLKAWLATVVRQDGSMSELIRPDVTLRRLGLRAGVPWRHNALRHSFISYRVAQTGDVPRTASEAGNSPRVVFQHLVEFPHAPEALPCHRVEKALCGQPLRC
ncbi:MAG: tyrosine-type recombinase/integrase [Limisphaerales bacterium]